MRRMRRDLIPKLGDEADMLMSKASINSLLSNFIVPIGLLGDNVKDVLQVEESDKLFTLGDSVSIGVPGVPGDNGEFEVLIFPEDPPEVFCLPSVCAPISIIVFSSIFNLF
jgi:hypothetical protein